MSGSSEDAPLEPTLQTLEMAILRTIAYADVFEYPLTLDQIHRYLVGVAASLSAVRYALHSGRLVPRQLTCTQGYYSLAGRASTVQTRLRRAGVAARMWPTARRYGLSISALPFVRMVAITGTLAVDNVEAGADIDYLIVTTPNRVWLARSLAIVLVYRGRLERVELCPNYVLSIDALDQFDRTIFSAHELAQMVPLHGLDVYDHLVQSNRWASAYLPNAFGSYTFGPQVASPQLSRVRRGLKQGIERALQGKLGDLWERRESSVKISQLRTEAACSGASAAAFGPQRCKGHMDDHGNYVQRAYAERLERLGIDAPDVRPQAVTQVPGWHIDWESQ